MNGHSAPAALGRRRVGIAFGLALFIGLSPVVPVAAAQKALYTAVVDAGSSGTRLHLYKVLPAPYPSVVEVATYENDDAEDGIDDFLDNVGGPNHDLGPDAVGEVVFKPLLDDVTAVLAKRGVEPSAVTVDVLATAGMRKAQKPIGTHSKAEIDAYYALIRDYIAGMGYVAGEARTTDGNSEEGVWSWIDLNDYYRQAFTTTKAPVGVVEVGGSSMQVSYPTTKPRDSSKNIYLVKINGKSFHVFSRTYLGLGQDDARKSMRVASPPDNGGAGCFPTGMKPSEDAGDLIDLALVKISEKAKFKPRACGDLYAATLDTLIAANGDPKVERSSGKFFGLSGVTYTLQGIGVSTERPSSKALTAEISAKCEPAGSSKNFDLADVHDQRTCASAAYIKALLYGPSGLFHDDPSLFAKSVSSSAEKDGKEVSVVSWTRGYLLLKFAE